MCKICAFSLYCVVLVTVCYVAEQTCKILLLNATNIFKVPEMPKKVVAVKKVPIVKKPETPEIEGIHVIINIIIL